MVWLVYYHKEREGLVNEAGQQFCPGLDLFPPETPAQFNIMQHAYACSQPPMIMIMLCACEAQGAMQPYYSCAHN